MKEKNILQHRRTDINQPLRSESKSKSSRGTGYENLTTTYGYNKELSNYSERQR